MVSILTVIGCLLFALLLHYLDWKIAIRRYKSTKGISFKENSSPRSDGLPLAGGLNKNYVDISEKD